MLQEVVLLTGTLHKTLSGTLPKLSGSVQISTCQGLDLPDKQAEMSNPSLAAKQRGVYFRKKGVISFATNLLPRPASSLRCGACPSKVRCSSFEAQPGLVRASLLLSFPHFRVWLPIFSNRPSWLASEAFVTSCGQTTLIFTMTCSSGIKVCHCGHVKPKSWVSHMTAPASPFTCLHV